MSFALELLLIFIFTMGGGIVQSITGFGAGIVSMIFLSAVFPVYQAAAISSTAIMGFQIMMVITYRKHIQKKYLWAPLPIYLICSTITLKLSTGKNLDMLKLAFGVFLILVCLYFVLLQGKITVSGGLVSAIVCGALAGACSGAFGIGGPPMAIYYLALIGEDKLTYLGTNQAFFLMTCIYIFVVRIVTGILTVNLIPYIIVAFGGLMAGKKIGTKILYRISGETFKKLVYLVIGLSGLINVVQNL